MAESVIWFLALSIVNALAGLLNYPLAPIAVLFQKDGWLPKWLWWMQTPDNSLDGDDGWKEKHVWLNPQCRPEDWLLTYIKRVLWLYRNSMYGLSIYVLGGHVQPRYQYEVEGDERTGNRPLVEGTVFRKVTNPDGSVYWQWYHVKAWNATMCIRINLGWKLWSVKKGDIAPQLVLSANPFMGYSREIK